VVTGLNRGGWRIDVGGIAAPILNNQGIAIAGLCVAAPSYRMNKVWFDRIVPATLRATAAITRGFGARDRRQGGAIAS